jgi:hypothetical protein
VQLSVKYETVLNMTTAKALGLDVPTSILLSADEPIEWEYRNARRLDRRRQQWVIRDRYSSSCLPVHDRFGPKATYIRRCREMTRWAMKRTHALHKFSRE